MPGMVCEICRFHPATQQVAIEEGGQRREVAVCDVHRRVALAGSAASADATMLFAPMNNLQRRKASLCSN